MDIYCRTATEDEETQTKFEQQETACRAYCKEHGLEVGTVYREVASGNMYRERPQLSHMRYRYCKGEIQGVVVSDLHRLSRSQIHLLLLMVEMADRGVMLHSVNEQKDDGVAEIFVRLTMNFLAEFEYERTLDTFATDLER
jgi:DNA invertase Pin-like site-specific DNA recombinase